MKNTMIFFIFLIILCALCDCEKCFKNGTNSLEIYCDNFTATVPDDCIECSKCVPNEYAMDSNGVFQYLKLGGCDIDQIETIVFNFSTLFLDISYSGYTKLRNFQVKNVYLMKINVSHNEISHISHFPLPLFIKTPNLKELDFSFNKIDIIQKYDFEGALLLTTIYLSHNKIRKIANEAFVNLNDLTFIDLTKNSITSFGAVFRNDTKLKTLLLKENPIKAIDCNISRLAKKECLCIFLGFLLNQQLEVE